MSKSKSPEFSVRDFFARFPDDDACLDHVMEVRYGHRHECGKCNTNTTYHRVSGRPAYACASCGRHVHPLAGTIFQDTRTPLQSWFYAIYLFVTTRHGVSGKELQRVLGVTYKTGWRIGTKIRDLMINANGFEMLQGHIEANEAYVGGRRSGGKRGRGAEGKTIVFGLKERRGRLVAESIPNVKKATLRGQVLRKVEPGSIVSTDELMSYGLLTGDGYTRGMVKHGAKEWSYYDYRHGATHHVNHVENFWKLFKHSVRSTHIHVSSKYMDRYIGEFTFRSNHREKQNAMFDLLIAVI